MDKKNNKKTVVAEKTSERKPRSVSKTSDKKKVTASVDKKRSTSK